MTLFQNGQFASAAGLQLPFKIECDALTDADWECIAQFVLAELPPFRKVVPVPSGGDKLFHLLVKHETMNNTHPTLVVDDVWTTGKSMLKTVHHNWSWIGFVVFSRGIRPYNVHAMWQLSL